MPVDRLLFFGAALLYLALPGHSLALLPGLPLGILDLVVGLSLLLWPLALRGAPPLARPAVALVTVLAVAKLALGWAAPAYGLLAEYRAGGPNAPIERSTEWRRLAHASEAPTATRVERALQLRGAEFPVHFFNDVH